jgi:hypothetical protein
VTDTLQLRIELIDVPDDEAGALATELSDDIVDASPEIEIRRGRSDPSAQDFGATLLLVLGTSAVGALAQGIASYIARRTSSVVKINDGKGGEIVLEGVSSRSATGIAERILELQNTRP